MSHKLVVKSQRFVLEEGFNQVYGTAVGGRDVNRIVLIEVGIDSRTRTQMFGGELWAPRRTNMAPTPDSGVEQTLSRLARTLISRDNLKNSPWVPT